MKKFFIAGVLLLLPTIVGAAGFAKQSLFLSKSSVTEGETVLIHATVSNDTAAKFTGTLKLHDEDGTIGSVPVTLGSGEAGAVSVSWKPLAGTHTVLANLEDSAGTVVEESSQTFTIAAKAVATPASKNKPSNTSATVEPSTQIQESIGSVSPTAQTYAAPVFEAIDAGRVLGASTINDGIDWSKKELAEQAQKQKTKTTSSAADQNTDTMQTKATNTAWTIFATVSLYVLSVLLYVVGNAGVFYPVFALLFFYILWRLFKRYRRPNY
ncbi:MAG: hypothetical protein WCK46_03015 [Candidatus Adlerbacteria bacterium]